MRILYTNADSLSNKLIELEMIVQENTVDIILITEVKPKLSATELTLTQCNINGFDIFGNLDRDTCNSRGALIYVKSSLQAVEVEMFENFAESVWCIVTLQGNEKLLVGCVREENAGCVCCKCQCCK